MPRCWPCRDMHAAQHVPARTGCFDVYIDTSPSSSSILENGFFGSSSSGIDKESLPGRPADPGRAARSRSRPELLKALRGRVGGATRAEKEREVELETLTRRQRGLRRQGAASSRSAIEAVDREQAALATELVHTKVRERGAQGREREPQGPGARAARSSSRSSRPSSRRPGSWRADDLMKRNERVHGENQKLEKEMSELEEGLVQTKMKYAEVCTALSPNAFVRTIR